tara:strand:+ start:878 stop:1609 length:732 start_codon:yes stop_codon:yes gene_type:complete
MTFPTWNYLIQQYCTDKHIMPSAGPSVANPHYEGLAIRRYNYSPRLDKDACRLVFLKGVSSHNKNNTLRRGGRFIWCQNLRYEGPGPDGLRNISFTVDAGAKRFIVGENNILCIPSDSFVNNNRYFRTKNKTFIPFATPLGYENVWYQMAQNQNTDIASLKDQIFSDNPYVPGTLVAPRIGYFYPDINQARPPSLTDTHPCGLVLGPSFQNNSETGRDFYRVRFGDTTYERVHPVQMEIMNEV